MQAYVQVSRPGGSAIVVLSADRVSIGKAATNDIVIDTDATVSRLHAMLEPTPGGWCIRDLGSRNGTYVNGVRLLTDKALHSGDEIRVGETRLSFRAEGDDNALQTEVAAARPTLTPREFDVLVTLCAPVFTANVFTEPASIRDIAAALVVTEAAVKQHLTNLYEKFGLHTGTERRRVALANEAIRRGVVTLADLRANSGGAG